MDSHALRVDFAPLAGKRVLAALSGGADSVALLLLLRDAGIEVCAAHFEHGIRGAQSAADMAFCRDLCARLGVPFLCERGDVPGSRRTGEGMEAAARRLRYAFLERARLEAGAEVIAVAHHADDQAETVLMHLLRGAGPRGASGMRAENALVRRPLLEVRRRELEAYLRARGQDWREDASNRACDTPRNALRLRVLPRIEEIYPGAVRALGRFARAQAAEDAFMDALARDWARANRKPMPNGCCYACDALPDEAVLRRALRIEIGEEASFAQTLRLAALAREPRGRMALADGRLAEKTPRALFVTDPALRPPASAAFALAGTTELAGLARFAARKCAPVPVRDELCRQVLARAALEGAVARTRREGDFIYPLGMRGRKLLSDYMIDKKVDRPLRDWVALIARGSEVLWAVGLGISARCAVGEGTDCVEVVCRYAAENQYFSGGTKA